MTPATLGSPATEADSQGTDWRLESVPSYCPSEPQVRQFQADGIAPLLPRRGRVSGSARPPSIKVLCEGLSYKLVPMWYLLVTANYQVLGRGTRHCSLDSFPLFSPCPPSLQNKTHCGALEVSYAHIFQRNPVRLGAGVSRFKLN